MGPFGRITSKLKGQQKETCKNGKQSSVAGANLQKEHDQVLSIQRLQGKSESKLEEDVAGVSRCKSGVLISKVERSEEKVEQKESARTGKEPIHRGLNLHKEPLRPVVKGTRTLQNDIATATKERCEIAVAKAEETGAEDAKAKAANRKESKHTLNVQKVSDSSVSLQRAGKKGEGKLEENASSASKRGVPAAVYDTKVVKSNYFVAAENSDLETSTLTRSLGLNRIKTRSGPLYEDGLEGINEVSFVCSKYVQGEKAKSSAERGDKGRFQEAGQEASRCKELDSINKTKFKPLVDGEGCKSSVEVPHHGAAVASRNLCGESRRKSRGCVADNTSEGQNMKLQMSSTSPRMSGTDSQRSQTGLPIRRTSDGIAVPVIGQVGNCSIPVTSMIGQSVEGILPCSKELPRISQKTDHILEKRVPSRLSSYLDNEGGKSPDAEASLKQLDVIKETESPKFQSVPHIAEVHKKKKWPKDIKSFSHELGPRGGRSYGYPRPHSDNDLEELLAALQARFNTAKEEVDAELKVFAADLVEILDRNADSFPQWQENVEDLLVLARRCAVLSPYDFRRECESIVQELDDRRQELPMGLLKQLHTRMLFILTRCTRLLQFQKETSPGEEGFHKIQQCLKGVPSLERTWTSAVTKKGKAASSVRRLLPEVLEQTVRGDVALSKIKGSKHTRKPRKPRFPPEKAKLVNQRQCSPNISQVDSLGANRLTISSKSIVGLDETSETTGCNHDLASKRVKPEDNSAMKLVQETWDQTDSGKLYEDEVQPVTTTPSKQSQKYPWGYWTDSENVVEEPNSVICRICEEEVPTSHLEAHSLICTLADNCDVQGLSLDERLRILADNLERIAELNTPKCIQVGPGDSPDGIKPFKLNLQDGLDSTSPNSNDFQGKVVESRFDDICVSDTASIAELRGLSLISFKRHLGPKSDQGVASSSAGSGTPRSTLTTPRTSQLDLLWAERNSLAESEDISQIYELAVIARFVANKGPMEEDASEYLVSCLQDLQDVLGRNKIEALTVDTFGRRIENLLREKYLICETGDQRKLDLTSSPLEDDGMSTDDGVQSFKSTPTHPAYKDRITIEDFEILKPISRGAFGRVFLARKRATGDLFAIKVLRKIDMIRKNAVENILAERDILITVCNPFVVRFFYSFTCRDNLYLVMEYLNGGDLYSLLRNMGCIDEDVARVYMAELVLALEYLHSLGVVHRDLKPDNILIARDGHIKLTDFGLSKVGLINSTDDLSGPGASGTVLMDERIFEDSAEHAPQRERRKERSAVGTPDYLAPEILLGTEHGYTADWWSAGVILFECLTGLPPFNAEHPQIIFDNILNRKIPWPHIPEDMSYEAQDLIVKLLTEDPNQRLGSRGAPEVKNHPFFKDISWDTLARQKAAFVPSPESVDDTSYFTSRHLEGYGHSSQQFADSSDCSTSCSSTNSLKARLNEGEDECGDLAEFESSPSVEYTFNNFSFKNLSQLASINYDLLLQTGKDPSKGHSRHPSAS